MWDSRVSLSATKEGSTVCRISSDSEFCLHGFDLTTSGKRRVTNLLGPTGSDIVETYGWPAASLRIYPPCTETHFHFISRKKNVVKTSSKQHQQLTSAKRNRRNCRKTTLPLPSRTKFADLSDLKVSYLKEGSDKVCASDEEEPPGPLTRRFSDSEARCRRGQPWR